MIKPQLNRPYTNDGKTLSREGLEMLLSLFDQVEAQQAKIEELEARIAALEP